MDVFAINIDESHATHVIQQPSSSSLVSSLLHKHLKYDQNTSTLGEEISRFQNLAHSDDDILVFWEKNANNFPKLARIAKVVLSIPLTSAKAESAFSIAGSVIRKKRASITPFRAEKTLFIHDNYDLINLKRLT